MATLPEARISVAATAEWVRGRAGAKRTRCGAAQGAGREQCPRGRKLEVRHSHGATGGRDGGAARAIAAGSKGGGLRVHVEGEEALLLDSLPPDVVTILAPRHPERFEVCRAMLVTRGANFVRRSQWMAAPSRSIPGMVFLLDSIGELASVYSLASIAVVGGGIFVPGGHNPLEPAQFARADSHGPALRKFSRNRGEAACGECDCDYGAGGEWDRQCAICSRTRARQKPWARGRGRSSSAKAGATGRAVEALLAVLKEQRMIRPFAYLVPLYAAAVGAKNAAYERGWAKPERLAWPVVSVGNVSVGGAGKTPLVIRLAQLLVAEGARVDVLSRGYGRHDTGGGAGGSGGRGRALWR